MTLATGPYQDFDQLSPDEYAALEADILERGVLVAIEFDEDGNVLDGHHRKAICDKHGITDYPKVIRRGLSEAEKRSHARKLNMARRHLTREQKQHQIRKALLNDPESSDRKLAAELQVDHKTIASHRKKLVDGGEIPHIEETVGMNGMRYSREHRHQNPVDACGNEVPDRLARVFGEASEFDRLDNILLDVLRRVKELGRSNKSLKADKITAHIEGLQASIAKSRPHAVHLDCGGGGCRGCRQLGFVPSGEIPQQTENPSQQGTATGEVRVSSAS